MKKYLVETYYTCTFKTVHTLNTLDDSELNKIDQRSDGEVEVIDVKLNNRKTKKISNKKNLKEEPKMENSLPEHTSNQVGVKRNDTKNNHNTLN